jgi:hypothetical protein
MILIFDLIFSLLILDNNKKLNIKIIIITIYQIYQTFKLNALFLITVLNSKVNQFKKRDIKDIIIHINVIFLLVVKFKKLKLIRLKKILKLYFIFLFFELVK